MTAEEALNFIHEKMWRGSKPGLDRTRLLLKALGDPQDSLRFIHISGTNGKGSIAAMLASILTAAGHVTGLYTSPYITRFNERMQVDGQPISDGELAELTALCAPAALAMEDRPTEFELVTAIAFLFFKRRGCGVVVLETGMGGRLDSTNVIKDPLCTVISNIGLDHTRELGDTVEKIAAEKAGIIKPLRPTVIYDLPPSVRAVILEKCREAGSPLYAADFGQIISETDGTDGQTFSYKSHRRLFLPLLGEHQLKNAAVALETVDLLRENGVEIGESAVPDGLKSTVWPARFEILSENPCFVLDGGHNPQCAETVAENLRRYFPGRKTVILFGVLADKDVDGLASILNTAADEFFTITPNSPRALSAEALAERLRVFGKSVTACGSIDQGVDAALAAAGDGGVVCAVGSLYSAGAIRAHFGK